MRSIKTFLITVIAVVTALSIIYLVFQAKRLERYTVSISSGSKCFIIYSSEGGSFKDGKTIDDVQNSLSELLKLAGYDAIKIRDINDGSIRKKIISSIRENKKYILLDINATNAVNSKNAILLRVGMKDNNHYRDNMDYAKKIKDTIEKSSDSIKVNVLGDSRSNLNQDLGDKSIKVDISSKNNLAGANMVLSYLLKPIIE